MNIYNTNKHTGSHKYLMCKQLLCSTHIEHYSILIGSSVAKRTVKLGPPEVLHAERSI